jgi:hypothetical protein
MMQNYLFFNSDWTGKRKMLKEIKDLAAVLIGWIVGDLTFFLQFLDVLVNSEFGNGADGGSAHFERYPFIRFRNEELLGLKVWVKATTRFPVRVGNIVS